MARKSSRENALTEKNNRKFSAWKYSLRKLSLKFTSYHPPPFFIAVIVMAVAIFLLGGGIYDILIGPAAAIPLGSGRFLSYFPYQIHEQLLVGSLAVMVLYALGATGLLLIYRSTKYVRDPHQASMLIGVGAVLILIAYVAIEVHLYWILHGY